MDHIEAAVNALAPYGLGSWDAEDAACDVLQAAVKEKVKEYKGRAWDNDTSATERALLFVRIDTLMTFAELKDEN